MSNKILILGGTKEAAALAAQLVKDGHDVTTSLAGRTEDPIPLSGKIRSGGFGGAVGLADWMRENSITKLIDATHPFAEQISKNAVEAASLSGISLEIISRAPWQQQLGDQWTEVSSLSGAARCVPNNATVFLALGSQHLEEFQARDDIRYIIRMIDQPKSPLPFINYKIISGKPSSNWRDEARLFKQEGITHIVCRNSGGDGAYAKIKAARKLRLPVIILVRKS